MAPEEPAKSSPARGVLAGANDRLRETTKWLITIFAGVGGALVAGSSLSDVGELEGWDLALAVAAVLVGLSAVAFAINAALEVLTVSRVNLAELADTNNQSTASLRTRVNSDPALLAGYADVQALAAEYTGALSTRKQAFDEYYAAVDDSLKEKAADVADARAQAVSQAVANVLGVASFEQLSSTFGDVKRRMLRWAVVAALAILGFAVVTSRAGDEPSQLITPAEVTIKLTDEGREVLAESPDGKCEANTVRAIVVGYDGEKADVVTLPKAGCRVVRAKSAASLGAIQPPKK